ncbi:SNF1-interacting protein [Coemansia thaxteri]|nr:SNF1-interacting protein [Coemansia thaxteri]
MGNAGGRPCDGGALEPTGIYASDAQDFDAKVVQRLILARHLAPFYAGADDPDTDDPRADGGGGGDDDDGWWSYSLMVAQQKQQQTALSPDAPVATHSRQASTASESLASPPASPVRGHHARKGSGFLHRLRAGAAHGPPAQLQASARSLTASPTVEPARHERSLSELGQSRLGDSADAWRVLRRSVECPICFLYYPQNTNYTRCCRKPICTECFVQIKRKIEGDRVAPTHCPYCVEPNLGVAYYAPAMAKGGRHRAQLSHGSLAPQRALSQPPDSPTVAREPAVVMSDDIRPARIRELTAELHVARREQQRSAETMALVAAATRRASASAAAAGQQQRQPPPPPLPARLFGRLGRQPQTTALTPEYAAYAAAMRAAGQTDLEEFLVQEAIRLSLAASEQTAGASSEGSSEGGGPAVSSVAVSSAAAGASAAPADDPLVLGDAELDAIAGVTSRPRPAAAAAAALPSLSDLITSPAAPDDLMSFADANTTAGGAPPVSPARRRRPPPPPPPSAAVPKPAAARQTQLSPSYGEGATAAVARGAGPNSSPSDGEESLPQPPLILL